MHSIKHANEYFSSKQKCPHPLYDVFNMHRLRIFFFIPLMPVPPEVTSASRVYGYFGRPAVIICHVHTLVPFQLSWQRDGIDLGPSVTHPWVAIVIYEYSGWNSLILCYRNKLSQSQVGWLTVRISYVIFILSSLRTQVFLCGKRMSPRQTICGGWVCGGVASERWRRALHLHRHQQRRQYIVHGLPGYERYSGLSPCEDPGLIPTLLHHSRIILWV